MSSDVCTTFDISDSMSRRIGSEKKDSKTRNYLSIESIVILVKQLNDEGIAINIFENFHIALFILD